LESVNKGFARAQNDIAKWPQVKRGEMPQFQYGIIGCAMRKFAKNFSKYYRDLLTNCAYMPQDEAFATASLELARALVDIRDRRGIPIVSFDLAGEEHGYPAVTHKAAYQYVLKNFMCRTVHAGEAFGPPSIFQAITDLYAERIGHGEVDLRSVERAVALGDLVRLTRALERCEVPNEGFPHASHLRVAWVYLHEAATIDEAIARMASTLRRVAASVGKAEKYSDATTVFWMLQIAAARAVMPGANVDAVLRAYPRLLDKHFICMEDHHAATPGSPHPSSDAPDRPVSGRSA